MRQFGHGMYKEGLLAGRLLLWAAGLQLAATFACAQAAAPAGTSLEQDLFRMTNTARSEQGLAPLQWNDALAQAARNHADLILKNGQLSHDYPGEASLAARAAQAGAQFQTISENIAQGPSAGSIQKSWMNSPPHRANILDPNLNAAGFAVVEHAGTFYAVADFSRSVAALSPDQIEAAVGKLLTARGLQIGGSVPDARKTCEMDEGSAPGSKPLFVMRWESSDLSRLPDVLEERIRSGRYHTAVAGACSGANPQSSFSSYRIAVLLY